MNAAEGHRCFMLTTDQSAEKSRNISFTTGPLKRTLKQLLLECVLSMWSQLFSHLKNSAHRCHCGILQVYWPILKGCIKDSMKSSTKVGLLTFLTTMAFYKGEIHNWFSPVTPPPSPKTKQNNSPPQKKIKNKIIVIERLVLSFLYWPQWDSRQPLVSPSYTKQQLRSSAVIKPGTIRRLLFFLSGFQHS